MFQVKRATDGKWGGMYDDSRRYGSLELAKTDERWVKRETARNGNVCPVVIMEFDQHDSNLERGVIVEAYAPDGIIPA